MSPACRHGVVFVHQPLQVSSGRSVEYKHSKRVLQASFSSQSSGVGRNRPGLLFTACRAVSSVVIPLLPMVMGLAWPVATVRYGPVTLPATRGKRSSTPVSANRAGDRQSICRSKFPISQPDSSLCPRHCPCPRRSGVPFPVVKFPTIRSASTRHQSIWYSLAVLPHSTPSDK